MQQHATYGYGYAKGRGLFQRPLSVGLTLYEMKQTSTDSLDISVSNALMPDLSSTPPLFLLSLRNLTQHERKQTTSPLPLNRGVSFKVCVFMLTSHAFTILLSSCWTGKCWNHLTNVLPTRGCRRLCQSGCFPFDV